MAALMPRADAASLPRDAWPTTHNASRASCSSWCDRCLSRVGRSGVGSRFVLTVWRRSWIRQRASRGLLVAVTAKCTFDPVAGGAGAGRFDVGLVGEQRWRSSKSCDGHVWLVGRTVVGKVMCAFDPVTCRRCL